MKTTGGTEMYGNTGESFRSKVRDVCECCSHMLHALLKLISVTIENIRT